MVKMLTPQQKVNGDFNNEVEEIIILIRDVIYEDKNLEMAKEVVKQLQRVKRYIIRGL